MTSEAFNPGFTMSKRLQLVESLPRGLRFGQDVRTDLRLLEVDEKLLQEMLIQG